MYMKRLRAILPWIPLFAISFLSLFFELAVIRWVSGEVRLFSYFKNLPLLAAFLGLAIGFGLAGKGRDTRSAFAPFLLMLALVIIGIGRFSSQNLIYPAHGDDFLWFTGSYSYWISLLLFLGVVLLFFLLIMFVFIPLGQATGEEMSSHKPVPAYIVNILASLLGVWAFALVSYLETPPVVWIGLALIGCGIYFAHRKAFSRTSLLIFVATFILVAVSGGGAIWSPYQRLDVSEMHLEQEGGNEPINVGYTLNVQQVFYMNAIDLSPDFLTTVEDELPGLLEMARSYDLPFELLPEGSRVLIVGSGMGNDVAAALRGGVRSVDAVEIDPTILEFGRQLHPEMPYMDSRVNTVVDDARAYFNESQDEYDAILFGLLDSHTLLSGMSTVRLDSFVYTIESFEQVRRHLADDGYAVVSFATSAPWIEERIGRMLGSVFGAEQVYVYDGFFATIFVAGPVSVDQLAATQLVPWQADPDLTDLPITTDDWPYLYLRDRIIPPAYWQALLLIGAAFLLIARRLYPEVMRPNWHFWLLGAAFLLIEFKSITELALLFGTTWLVNALAISGVLIMVLAANLVVLSRSRLDLRLAYILLIACLLVLFLFPLEMLAGLPTAVKYVGSVILLSLPLFFSGLIFSESLRRSGEVAGPLASNLSGTMVGGILEYGSLIWGIKSLYLIAMAVYIGAFFASRGTKGSRS
jgi:spermidine synthase